MKPSELAIILKGGVSPTTQPASLSITRAASTAGHTMNEEGIGFIRYKSAR